MKRKNQAVKDHKEAREFDTIQKSAARAKRIKAGTEKWDAVDSSDSDFKIEVKTKTKKK